MRVLMITGDKSFKKGHPRFDLQASAVDTLEVLYWGLDAPFPHIPKSHFDVVTTQDPFFRGVVAWIIARILKTRLNVQVHADIEKQNALKYFLARIVLLHADSIRVVSERVKNQLEKIKIHAPITVLPIYLDLEPFKALTRAPDTQPTVLWIGRFEDEKDPLFALNVLKQVHQKGIDAKLIMLGSGSLEGKLRTKAKAYALPVEFPGWQSPVGYIPRAHVVLSTSRAESWGASIIEALASGVPVVAPDVGSAREAGAIIAPKRELSVALIKTLTEKPTATLTLAVLAKDEWLHTWKQSLI